MAAGVGVIELQARSHEPAELPALDSLDDEPSSGMVKVGEVEGSVFVGCPD